MTNTPTTPQSPPADAEREGLPWDGMPVHPERDGWHKLSLLYGKIWVDVVLKWSAPRIIDPDKWFVGWLFGTLGVTTATQVKPEDMASSRYLGPVDLVATLTADRDAALAEVKRLREVEALHAKEWAHIHRILQAAQRTLTEISGVRHSWMDGAVDLALDRAALAGTSEMQAAGDGA